MFRFSTSIELIYILHKHLTHPQDFLFFNCFQFFSFIHIYDKIWTAFIFSCCPPLQGWRHLRWSLRSLCRTCSSPGCCICQSPMCSRRWCGSWRTCLTQTSGCSGCRTWSPCRSSARWPLARGRPKCCRWDWGPEGRIRHNIHPLIIFSCVRQVSFCFPITVLNNVQVHVVSADGLQYLALLDGDHVRQASCHSSTVWKKQCELK